MNYKEFKEMRVPQIEVQQKKVEWVRDYYLNKSKPNLTWGCKVGKDQNPHPNDYYVTNTYFIPSFVAVWNKAYNWNAKTFGALIFDHFISIEVKFLRFWFHLWFASRHQ